MIGFNYIQKDYIPGVNLETLGKTYNTLEQGHKEAVKAASDLKTVIANMDMNEEENTFKQQLFNNIQEIIDANTVYGNAYGSLDNLIAQQGNILSNKEVIAKLNAQKDYKAYLDKIDKSNLPEHYKEYYRKQNTYNGTSQYNNNGIFKDNYKWTPQETFVDFIDANKLIESVLRTAVPRRGGTNTFIDKDGIKIKKNTTWEILDKETLKRDIIRAFNNTPGMMDSLYQDYKIALQDHTDNVTDDSGNILQFNKWVNRFVDDFANNHKKRDVFTTSEYIEHPKTEQSNQSNNNDSQINNSDIVDANNRALSNAVGQGVYEVKINVLEESNKQRFAAANTFSNILNKAGGVRCNSPQGIISYVNRNIKNRTINGPVQALNEFFKLKNPKTGKTYGEIYTKEEKYMLYEAAKTWGTEQYNINKLMKKLSDEDKDALKFGQSIISGNYNSNNSVGDKVIINYLNYLYDGVMSPRHGMNKDELSLFRKYGNLQYPNLVPPKTNSVNAISITIPEDDMYNEILKYYNGELPNFITLKNNDDGSRVLSINSDNRTALPEFASIVMKANNNTTTAWNPGNWLSAINKGRKRLRFNMYRDDYKSTGIMMENTFQVGAFISLANLYNVGLQKSEKVSNRFNEINQSGLISQESTMYSTQTKAINAQLAAKGIIDSSEQSRRDKMAEELLDNAFGSSNFSAGDIIEIENYSPNNMALFKKSGKALETQALINKMYTAYKGEGVTRQYGIFRGLTNKNGSIDTKEGYYLSFTIPNDNKDYFKDFKHYKPGDQVKVFVAGTNHEGNRYNLATSTSTKADNALLVADYSQTDYNIIPFNRHLNNTSFRKNGNGYIINFLGTTINCNNKNHVKDYANALYTIEDAKQLYQQGYDQKVVLKNMQSVVNYLNQISGIDKTIIINKICNYIEDGETN